MVITQTLQRAICSLFQVHDDENGVQRVVTPLEYPGSNDQIVIRVRPTTTGYTIDENGDAAFYAGMNGGDVDTDAVSRWIETATAHSKIRIDDEVISMTASDERLIAPYIFRVADAAQQLFTIATARGSRSESDFKALLKQVIVEAGHEANRAVRSDVELPIPGGLRADHILEGDVPMIVIAASSTSRLLEAEVIYMQYRAEKRPGYIMAVAESQTVVGKKHFERAAYYTDRAVVFDAPALSKFVPSEAAKLN
jgi:hypothetical protein